MKYSLIILPILICAKSFGQAEITAVTNVEKVSIAGNTHSRIRIYAGCIGLCDLAASNDSLHFRFWTDKQAVDIWTNDFIHYEGLLVNYTWSSDHSESESMCILHNFFYSSVKPIDPVKAKEVYQLFSDSLVFEIPEGNLTGTDGYGIRIENSSPTNYSERSYFCPSYNKEIRDYRMIDYLDKKLDSMFNMEEDWKDFIEGLPDGCYHMEGLRYYCNMSIFKRTIMLLKSAF